jgi:membrane protein DedA with SNARE-associated domain
MNPSSFLDHYGYAALILLGFLEACCVPISSEVVFGFAGVLAYQGHLSLPLVIVAGTMAELAGSFVSYGVGRVGQRPFVERLSRYLLITRADLDRAERFLAGRGGWAIPLGRALPLVRSFTSVVAGFANVPVSRFGVLSLLGTVIYVASVAGIGYGVGSAWRGLAHDMSVSGYVIAAAAAIAVIAFVLIRLRALRHEARAAAAGETSDSPSEGAGPAPGRRQ